MVHQYICRFAADLLLSLYFQSPKVIKIVSGLPQKLYPHKINQKKRISHAGQKKALTQLTWWRELGCLPLLNSFAKLFQWPLHSPRPNLQTAISSPSDAQDTPKTLSRGVESSKRRFLWFAVRFFWEDYIFLGDYNVHIHLYLWYNHLINIHI